MGFQFQSVMQSSDMSLTLILDDIMRQRRDGALPAAQPEHEAWLNALLRQSVPLVYSASGRESLEAWLAAVEQSA